MAVGLAENPDWGYCPEEQRCTTGRMLDNAFMGRVKSRGGILPQEAPANFKPGNNLIRSLPEKAKAEYLSASGRNQE